MRRLSRFTLYDIFFLVFLTFCWSLAQGQESHSVETVNGLISVSTQPERVVVLDEGALDTALSVGVTPIAALASRGGSDIAQYLQDHVTEPIAIVGTVREPNLEAIYRLRPDLILASSETNDALYQKLSRIAPTIVPPAESTFADWKVNVRLFAQALNKKEAIEEKLADIDAQLDMINRQNSDIPTSVAVVRWNPQGPVLMSGQLFTGQLIRAAGFATLPLADELTQRPHSDTLSLENLAQIDADWLLLASLNDDGQKALINAQEQAAFRRLEAVQNDQVTIVDGQVWSSGYGPLAAEAIIRDLEALGQ